jgi:hypothetical protein
MRAFEGGVLFLGFLKGTAGRAQLRLGGIDAVLTIMIPIPKPLMNRYNSKADVLSAYEVM